MQYIKPIFLTTVLLAGLITTTAFAEPAQADKKHQNNSILMSPDKLVWQKDKALPGVKMAILYGNPSKSGPFTIRLKFPANYQILAHSHPALEQDTVISGALNLGMGKSFDEKKTIKLMAGSFFAVSPGVTHFAWTSEETVLQITGQGPWQINYVSSGK